MGFPHKKALTEWAFISPNPNPPNQTGKGRGGKKTKKEKGEGRGGKKTKKEKGEGRGGEGTEPDTDRDDRHTERRRGGEGEQSQKSPNRMSMRQTGKGREEEGEGREREETGRRKKGRETGRDQGHRTTSNRATTQQ
jgi:hypothetical protein